MTSLDLCRHVLETVTAAYAAKVEVIDDQTVRLSAATVHGCPLRLVISKDGHGFVIGQYCFGGWDDEATREDVTALAEACLAGAIETIQRKHDQVIGSRVTFTDGSTYSWSRGLFPRTRRFVETFHYPPYELLGAKPGFPGEP